MRRRAAITIQRHWRGRVGRNAARAHRHRLQTQRAPKRSGGFLRSLSFTRVSKPRSPPISQLSMSSKVGNGSAQLNAAHGEPTALASCSPVRRAFSFGRSKPPRGRAEVAAALPKGRKPPLQAHPITSAGKPASPASSLCDQTTARLRQLQSPQAVSPQAALDALKHPLCPNKWNETQAPCAVRAVYSTAHPRAASAESRRATIPSSGSVDLKRPNLFDG